VKCDLTTTYAGSLRQLAGNNHLALNKQQNGQISPLLQLQLMLAAAPS
jgi:hypothetical protein